MFLQITDMHTNRRKEKLITTDT